MKLRRLFFIVMVIMSSLVITPFVCAQDSNTSESESSNPFLQGLMGILQEGIDEWIGNYKGRLGDVVLLERLGNRIVLEVTYDGVKRSDNVYVQGEVRYFGEKLEGFSNTLNTISGSRGKVKLAIGWSQGEDDGWETAGSEEKSDQIRLFLVRKSNPDRPFGEIIYDMAKNWIDSDAPDEEAMVADDSGIELEDTGTDESGSETKPPTGIFIKPGTILRPRQPVIVTQPGSKVATQTSTPTKTQNTTQTSPQTTVKPAPPVNMTMVQPNQSGVTSYNLYSNAKSAKWKSSAGPLPFPGSGNDKRGFVRLLSRGRLNTGNSAISLLQMHPQWKTNGWVDGHYPLMTLSNNLRFKSVVGFLQGASPSDGATFQVYIKENNRYYRVASNRVTSKKYVTIDADLSRWSGKKVQLVLRVLAGKTSEKDWAVWVKPRLSK